MKTQWIGGIAIGLLGGLALVAVAEEITLTTLYPAPRGVYDLARLSTPSLGTTEEKVQ